MTQTKQPVPKKVVGTKQTEAIIGTAASKLTAAHLALAAAFSQVSNLDALLEQKTLKACQLEQDLELLAQQVKNKTEQNKIEIRQRFESDSKEFVHQYVIANKLQVIAEDELRGLKTNLAHLKMNKEKELDEAVKAAVLKTETEAKTNLKLSQLEHDKKEAENKATIAQLHQQVVFLTNQVEMWKNALDAERAASIERAKAGAVGSITVNSQK